MKTIWLGIVLWIIGLFIYWGVQPAPLPVTKVPDAIAIEDPATTPDEWQTRYYTRLVYTSDMNSTI